MRRDTWLLTTEVITLCTQWCYFGTDIEFIDRCRVCDLESGGNSREVEWHASGGRRALEPEDLTDGGDNVWRPAQVKFGDRYVGSY
jgi:hypothetical protein